MAKPVPFLANGLIGLAMLGLAACGDEASSTSDPIATTAKSLAVPAEEKAMATKTAARPAGAAESKPISAIDAASATSTGERSGELIDPSGYDMYWVYVDWSGKHPDYRKAAERNAGVIGGTYDNQTVNEFNRIAFIEKELARLESLGASGRGVGYVTTNIGGKLGDYDPGYGEFYVGPLTPGSSISFSPTNWQVARETYKGIDISHVTLRLTNALDGYVWKVSADEAAGIIAGLEREGNVGRNIYARVRLQLEGVVMGSNPGMDAKVLSYSLHSQAGTELAEFDLTH